MISIAMEAQLVSGLPSLMTIVRCFFMVLVVLCRSNRES